VIIVSHRGPYRFTLQADGSFRAERGAGGVASALAPLVLGTDDITWVAAAMGDDDRAAVREGAAVAQGVDLQLLALDPELHRLHYDIISNATLWFLLHGLFDLPRRPRIDHRFREAWDAYVSVNHVFAERVAESAKPDEIVLVQDYQLTLVPGMVLARRPDLRVVHFTHTPFCEPTSMRVLPDYVARALCDSMSQVRCGFHTERWARTYEASATATIGSDVPLAPAFSAPLGIDREALDAVASSDAVRAEAAALDELIGDRSLILRSDRIDPSKNIVRGFHAYDTLLHDHPQWRGRVVFVAMLNASRQGLVEYLAYHQEVEEAAARVNERWATRDWQPIVLDTRDNYERSIAGLTRYDVLLINSLSDGLNLVAKEGPAVNQRNGTVCLSREAGAYDELHEAVTPVHPFDLQQTAAALHRALSASSEERAARATVLRDVATARTSRDWLDDLVREAKLTH
jgi:trehalose 6-phosphate synthase